MTAKELFQGISFIDEKYANEVLTEKYPRPKRITWVKAGAVAACLAIVSTVALTLFPWVNKSGDASQTQNPTEPVSEVTVSNDPVVTQPIESTATVAIINMSDMIINALSPYDIALTPPYRAADEYEWIQWQMVDIVAYFGRDITPAYVPKGLVASSYNGYATVIFDRNGNIVEDVVSMGFYHAFHDDGSPMLTDTVLAHKGFSVSASKLNELKEFNFTLPVDEVKTSNFGGVEVTIGYRSMPYGPYDGDTHEPSGYYDFYEVEFAIDGVNYQICSEQLEFSEIVEVTASVIFGNRYSINPG